MDKKGFACLDTNPFLPTIRVDGGWITLSPSTRIVVKKGLLSAHLHGLWLRMEQLTFLTKNNGKVRLSDGVSEGGDKI